MGVDSVNKIMEIGTLDWYVSNRLEPLKSDNPNYVNFIGKKIKIKTFYFTY
uniref:Uncharacterized protein n=1 Tax=Lepeophtheirus salmonis TaxID=72036 RepID=A0A0K2TVW9_LEPSM